MYSSKWMFVFQQSPHVGVLVAATGEGPLLKCPKILVLLSWLKRAHCYSSNESCCSILNSVHWFYFYYQTVTESVVWLFGGCALIGMWLTFRRDSVVCPLLFVKPQKRCACQNLQHWLIWKPKFTNSSFGFPYGSWLARPRPASSTTDFMLSCFKLLSANPCWSEEF